MKRGSAMQRALEEQRREQRQARVNAKLARFYNLNSILGNDWALFIALIGARDTGKSYAVTDKICRDSARRGSGVKNYWLRISGTSTQQLLANNAQKLVDPDLQRKYNLHLTTKGNVVYNDGTEFCTVLPLSSFGKQKGIAYYDKDFTGLYNIVLDEFQLEQGEKRTSFDILYNFVGMCENLVRTTKSNVKVFLLGNTLQEASAILKAFNFIPEGLGRYYLKRKRCVIDNMPITEAYKQDRAGSIADILAGGQSNFTNQLEKDLKSIYKGKVQNATYLIKFGKEKSRWFTVWDGSVIGRYTGQSLPEGQVLNMRPYLGGFYTREIRETVIDRYDARSYMFRDLPTQAYFTDELSLLRKQ